MPSAAAQSQNTLDREAPADLVEAMAVRVGKRAFAQLFHQHTPKIKAYPVELGAGAAALRFKRPLGLLQPVLNLGRG